jgi:hypothetical protein
MVDEMQGVKGRMGPRTVDWQLMETMGKIKELAIHGKIALLENDRAELGRVLVEIAELAGGERDPSALGTAHSG